MGNDLENDLANLLFGNDSEDDAIIVSDSPVKSIPLKSTSIIISDSPVKQPLATCTSANLFIPRKIQPKAQVMRQPTISSFIPPHQSSNKPKPVFNPHAQFNKQIQYVNLKTNSPHYVASPSKTTILSANISSTTNLNIVKLLEDISSQNDPQIEHPKIKCTLLPYQLTGVSWLVARETGIHRGAILADDMGLGKTIQTIALIANSSSSTTSTLIVAPLALITQWESEIKTKSSLRVYLHHGPSRSTEENYLKRFDVVVTTYSIVASESKVDGVLFKIKWHRIVLDEAQTIKNRNTASSLACCKLSSKYKLALSGTPIQNSIDDLYSLIKFLKINVFENYNNWKEKISTPLNNKRENGDAMERLRVLLKAIMLRRTKSTIIDGKHILELPNRNVEISKLKFSDQERKFYDSLEDKMKNRAKSVIKEAGKNQFILLTMLLRLRQACSHPHLAGFENTRDVEEGLDGLDSLMGSMNINQSCKICDLKEHCSDCSVLIALSLDQVDNAKSMDKKTNIINNLEKNWASSTKTRKLIEILTDIYSKSIDTKILVFSQFTTYLDIIQIALKQSNLDFRYARYDGSMNAREKESSLDSFRSNPTTRILLISLKSGSVGLNLVTANHLILTDLWWNPAVEEQAIDRVHRIGQKRNVFVTRLAIENSVEERILQLQESKRELIKGALSGELKANKLSVDDMMFLFGINKR